MRLRLRARLSRIERTKRAGEIGGATAGRGRPKEIRLGGQVVHQAYQKISRPLGLSEMLVAVHTSHAGFSAIQKIDTIYGGSGFIRGSSDIKDEGPTGDRAIAAAHSLPIVLMTLLALISTATADDKKTPPNLHLHPSVGTHKGLGLEKLVPEKIVRDRQAWQNAPSTSRLQLRKPSCIAAGSMSHARRPWRMPAVT